MTEFLQDYLVYQGKVGQYNRSNTGVRKKEESFHLEGQEIEKVVFQ